MFRNLLANMSPAVKNILILNVIFFFAQWALPKIMPSLMLFPFSSENFEPWQLATHFFMHGDFMHLFFNMFGIVIFGSHLERVWGAKRFFIFYVIAAIGAVIFTGAINFYDLSQIQAQLNAEDIRVLNKYIQSGEFNIHTYGLNPGSDWTPIFKENFMELYIDGKLPFNATSSEHLENYRIMYQNYSIMNIKWSVGASGALLGLLAGFVILFPNTELMLLFIPIPIKAKYLIGAYLAYQFIMWYQGTADGIDYGAHVGGAIAGALMVLYWRKKDRSNFW